LRPEEKKSFWNIRAGGFGGKEAKKKPFLESKLDMLETETTQK